MNQNKELANLLFKHVTGTREELLEKFPPRNKVTTRFAPSPTGFLHIGGVYTSLICRKFASQNNGVFFLRIEDTDKKREQEDSKDIILRCFNEFGIKIDEGVSFDETEIGNYGPYVQSKRIDIYHILAKYLVENGYAYPCFCTEEELNEIRDYQVKNKLTPGYYRNFAKYRDYDFDKVKELIENNVPYTLRFRVPDDIEERIEFDDLIKGHIEMENNVNDFVLLKENGIPTYHFAHACDDTLMHTTNVIRGDEWLSSVPVHIQLFNALNFERPQYAHVAPVMKQDGESRRKLSKRKDPESSSEFYLQEGYPIKSIYVYLYTLINSNFEEWYLNNQDKDINEFEMSFDNMSISGALYDLTKLNSISSEILYKEDREVLLNNLLTYAEKYNKELFDRLNSDLDFTRRLLNTQGENSSEHRKDLSCYNDFLKVFGVFYDDIYENSEFNKEQLFNEGLLKENEFEEVRNGFIEYFTELKNGNTSEELTLKNLSKNLGFTDKKKYQKNPELYKGVVFQFYKTLRLLLTHQEHGISIDDVIDVLGYDRVIERLKKY
jgi:glutamyl-tRNA synthetase